MSEQWRPVIGYEGLYEVSDCGRVRGVARILPHGRQWKGRVLKAFPNNHGYMTVNLSACGRVIAKRVHCLVLEAFVGPRPSGCEARHFPDGDKSNNAVSNLSWATHVENEADKRKHGTAPQGDRHPMAKLTAGDVARIRELLSAHVPQKEIAARFGVTFSMISDIHTGRSWSQEAI